MHTNSQHQSITLRAVVVYEAERITFNACQKPFFLANVNLSKLMLTSNSWKYSGGNNSQTTQRLLLQHRRVNVLVSRKVSTDCRSRCNISSDSGSCYGREAALHTVSSLAS